MVTIVTAGIILEHNINPVENIREMYTKITITKYCTKLKIQMLQKMYNIDVILVALI